MVPTFGGTACRSAARCTLHTSHGACLSLVAMPPMRNHPRGAVQGAYSAVSQKGPGHD